MSPDAAASYCVTNVCTKLEAIGQRVGQRYITHAARNHQWLLQDSLSRIKLLCRDAWMGLFGKHVDKLQTNHKGTCYLLGRVHTEIHKLIKFTPIHIHRYVRDR